MGNVLWHGAYSTRARYLGDVGWLDCVCSLAALCAGSGLVGDYCRHVIDEVFAIWLVLVLTPATLVWQIAAFVAFRFFDIVKCPPADYFDKKMKNGFGIMFDDAIAAGYAWLVLLALQYVIG